MSPQDNSFSNPLILTINPRDLATKVAVYRLDKVLFMKSIKHDPEDLKDFETVCEQTHFRKEIIMKVLKDNDIPLEEIKLIFGRGGLCKPVKSGIYEINKALKKDLGCDHYGMDILNLGGLLSDAIARELPGARAYIADPVVVDEFDEISRISGHPLFERKSIFHALNQKYIARRHARTVGKPYEELNLIVISLGRAISIGAHHMGRVIDATQGFDGDGPFSPICSGTLPVGDVIRLCFSGKYSEEEVLKMVRGEGGLLAYLKTNNGHEVERMVDEGDKQAKLILEAMAYQVAQGAGSMAMAFKEGVDAIVITGNLANSKTLVDFLKERLVKLGAVHIYPGDDELRALAMNAMMLIKGQAEALEYK